ncbi:MAG: hypothetical protein EP326_12735 [Deltaproteobacteria bacterium]|nr:MAG: hypothetical protein EP326_12735 [Deltaproteobacteria bacterium]
MKLSWPVVTAKFFHFILLVIVASCAKIDVDYHMPINRYETPEVRGERWKGYASVNGSSTQKLTLTEVFDDTVFNTGPSVDDEPKMEKSFALGLRAGINLFENFDVFYRSVYDSPDQIGMKYQMMGEGSEKKSEGHKMAVTFAFGSTDRSDGDLQLRSDTSNQTRTYNSNLKISSWDFAWLYGYRKYEWLLLYSNVFWTQYKVESHLTSNVHPDVGVTGIAKTKGLLLGARFNGTKSRAFFTLEGGLVNTNWNGDINTSTYTIGGDLGFVF